MLQDRPRLRAALMLVLATACWSVSFPTMKALTLTQQALVPGASSWFVSTLCIATRFGAAGLIILLLCFRTIRQITRLEWWQGIGLGVFGGIGMILQMDGLAYTHASISAFLTQCYSLFIPLWLAYRLRRWPSWIVMAGCLMVVTGVAILSGLDWHTFHLGRGETETILSSVFFTGQILWLQRRAFTDNSVNHFTVVMFFVMVACCLPVLFWSTEHPRQWVIAYSTGPTWLCSAILLVISTLGGYMLMNHWQPEVPATQAGLIYAIEPVLASAVSLVMPGWFSLFAGIRYPNEVLSRNLLLGGGLILAANVLIQFAPHEPTG